MKLVRIAHIVFPGKYRILHRDKLLELQAIHRIFPTYHVNKAIRFRQRDLDSITDRLTELMRDHNEVQAIIQLRASELYRDAMQDAVDFNEVLF